ncbi:MAG: PBECR4 domain-containing protein [Clostridia bacterium]
MDKLLACAKAFENLTHTEYKIVLGRKGEKIELRIRFLSSQFHHLMGLVKLRDLEVANQNRFKVFTDIINNKLTYAKISTSEFISQIEDRFIPLANIEKILDNNNLVFRYNEKINAFSFIQADFLLSTPLESNDIYIFISKNEDNTYFCRSFFPKTNRDYTKGQIRYTLLYKEKINLKTGETVVQYDKLRK